jgi:glucose/arabinose dehydrogenase
MLARDLLRGSNLILVAVTIVAGAILVWFVARGGMETAAPASSIATTSPPTTSEGGQGGGSTSSTGASASTSTTLPRDPLQGLAWEVIADGLDQPVFATTAPGDERIFVVERSGRIQIVDPATGQVGSVPFLDIASKTLPSKGIELGLLGLAFHPDYEQNGRLFVYYTDLSNDTAVAEYARIDADTANPGSERIFVRVAREGLRHNAGMLQFGPDGYLWIAIGDGGLFEVHGQDNTQFLGTILRLDLDGGLPYAVPPDNPFVDAAGAPEVWAYGLRNPWRFDIDAESRHIYVGDVGQANAEEIDAVPLTPDGWNFGWPVMEGPNCWLEPSGCDTDGLTLPITSYSHADGCSVTGGVVYRGDAIPELDGHYFYADWCFGWVRSLLYSNGQVSQEQDWSSQIGEIGMVSSFGVDANGEILITTSEGTLGRIVPTR